MNTTIDFTKLQRIPTPTDIEKAQEKLEIVLNGIIKKHEDYFSSNNYPEKIEYIISNTITTEFRIFPYPEISFLNTLSEEIKKETALKFYEFLFATIDT